MAAWTSFPFRARRDGERSLPAPGPAPLERPRSASTIVILIVVFGGVLWLMARGVPAEQALGIAAAIGVVATDLDARLGLGRPGR